MATNIKITDIDKKAGLKGLNLDYWGGLEGFLAATSSAGTTQPQQLRRVVPWLAKATDMTAAAVANLPFYIYRGDEVYDSSADWKNRMGGMKNPDTLFYLLASSLCMGRAYLIPNTTGKVIASLQYCTPTSVTPNIDREGLQWFDRTTERGKTERYYPAPETPQMMYFWLSDPDVEIGPALTYPAGEALMASSLLFSMDDTIKTYAERGFVPATLLSVKGMPATNERERAEGWWNRFLRGWTKEAAKILNAEMMDVKQVGAGMEQLKGSYIELTKQMIENIGTAYGIPSGLFMADMSYATEVKHLIKLWYSTSAFVKIYRAIETTFNDQLFDQWGLRLQFAPDEIDAFQEEEVERATAFKVYIDAGIKHSVAAQMIGLELPEGVEFEDLDKAVEERADKAREQFEQTQDKQVEENPKPLEKKGWVTLDDGRHVLLDDEYDARDGIVEGEQVSGGKKQPWQMTKDEWAKERESVHTPGIAGEVSTTGPRAVAQMNKEKERIERVEELNYGVHDKESQIIREHSAAINEHRQSPYSFEEVNRAYESLQRRVTHRDVIEKALTEGKGVPRKVLEEYPDLMAKYNGLGKSVSFSAEQIKELNLWRQIAERNFKKGKGACADFDVKHLDESAAGVIRLRLQNAKSIEDVAGAFVVSAQGARESEVDRNALMVLADAINRAVDAGVNIDNPA